MYDINFRLPKKVKPLNYDIKLDVDLDNWKYSGEESIEVNIIESTDIIALHSVGLDIAEATLNINDEIITPEVLLEKEAELIVLKLSKNLKAGQANIRISFEGIITERLRGFYRSQKDGDRYAVTQFEAADARSAFPCFDEPEFKAKFKLSLIVPENVSAISNGEVKKETQLEDGKKLVEFGETLPISTYLVAFCIGPFEATPEAQTKRGVPVRVQMPRGMSVKGIYGRDAHVKALEYLEEYTDLAYPFKKVDALGIPDFEAGAMENPGAITYRLTELTADPNHASENTLKAIYYTASHELTHMWWGDLVTMKWWNDLWLNESFATVIGYKVTDACKPEWELWRDFVANLTIPFSLDSLVSTHPISFEVKNVKQATERFDAITYWKGGAVVRMLEGYMGENDFRAGVRSYLKKFKESNAEADDFWKELKNSSGLPIDTIANAWIKKPGHPVIDIKGQETNEGIKLIMQQHRFFADREKEDESYSQIWPIPLIIKYCIDEKVEEFRVMLDKEKDEVMLPKADWYFPNGNANGFFRFTLDENYESRLVSNINRLQPHERLSFLDNQWALLRSGRLSLDKFSALLEGFKNEDDRAVLSAIVNYLSWMDAHIVTDNSRSGFQKFIRDLLSSHYEQLGWEPVSDESVDVKLKRSSVIRALGFMGGDEKIKEEARNYFEKHLKNSAELEPNLRSVVTHLVAKDGDIELYQRYLSIKQKSSSDPEAEKRFLIGLTYFESPDLVVKTLELCLTEEVRPQDRSKILSNLLGQRHSRIPAWKFVQERWGDFSSTMDPMMLQNLVKSLGQLAHEPIFEDVQNFIKQQKNELISETVEQVHERLRIDAPIVAKLKEELKTFFS